MRPTLVVLLALVVAVAPAAQASACTCATDEASREDGVAGCCCAGPGGACCGCCGTSEEGGDAGIEAGCPCVRKPPLATERPGVGLPDAAVSAAVARVPLRPRGPCPVVPVRSRARDPAPEVLLPLLI